MTAVLRVHLRKTKHLAIGQLATNSLREVLQIGHLIFAQRQTLLLVVGSNIIDINDRIGLLTDRVNVLIDGTIQTTQHRIVRGILAFDNFELLDTCNTLDTHILGNLDGIGTPRGDHFTAWADEDAVENLGIELFRFTEKPSQLGKIRRRKLLARIDSINDICFSEKEYHSCWDWFIWTIKFLIHIFTEIGRLLKCDP